MSIAVRKAALSEEHERDIRRLIIDHAPDQMKMDFALWTRQAVRLLIEQRCGVHLTLQGVGPYLRRWGFTPQKPIQRAYEQQGVISVFVQHRNLAPNKRVVTTT